MVAPPDLDAASRRFLVVGPAWIGDTVAAHCVVLTLASRHPGCEIDVLAPQWSLPLLARMPMVGEAVALPVGHGEFGLAARRAVGRMLRPRRYDRAIVLPRTWKSALVPWIAHIPQRTGYRGEMRFGLINDIRPLDPKVLPQLVQRYVALALEPGDPLPPAIINPRLTVDTANAARVMTSLGLDDAKPIVVLVPGAEYGPSKKWPARYYAELALRILADGYQVWVLGSERDRADADEIEAATGGAVRNLCGRTRLVDAIDLLAQARLAVTNDSGLLYVAAAVGCPVVGLYGSTTPEFARPLTDRGTSLYLNLECSPCRQRECPLGHQRCLKDLRSDVVYAAAREQLSRAS